MQLWDVDSFSLKMKQCAIFAEEVLVISLVFVHNAGKKFSTLLYMWDLQLNCFIFIMNPSGYG